MTFSKIVIFLVLFSVSSWAFPHHGHDGHGHGMHDEVHSTSVLQEACESLSPKGQQHGNEAQTIQSPYTIEISSSTVKAGDKLTVTISGPETDSFKGFMVQARDSDGHKVGKFIATDDHCCKTFTCDNEDDTITQKSISLSLTKVTFDWVAPDNAHGPVVFYVTVVKNMRTYWEKLPSTPITVE